MKLYLMVLVLLGAIAASVESVDEIQSGKIKLRRGLNEARTREILDEAEGEDEHLTQDIRHLSSKSSGSKSSTGSKASRSGGSKSGSRRIRRLSKSSGSKSSSGSKASRSGSKSGSKSSSRRIRRLSKSSGSKSSSGSKASRSGSKSGSRRI
eukprot:CAMPEP_0183743300 /NCGR_PEP_ID=MMETSP0737-20130205/65145_1 /TAXON_ID=385413 /ORGANISM="Thalassiosira miniscula, Strain CCMP1093" /LENGTH=151 /DNA_ID=CAMNT_0025978911 /DNA_START=157 /DNA_END=612 /DNA_ORIENTATION=+